LNTIARSKSDLEILLEPYSHIPGVKLFKKNLEQYPTPTSVAAHMVWVAFMKGKMTKSTTLDLGCGNGVLVTASILIGSSRGICVDIDEDLLEITRETISSNYMDLSYRVIIVEADATVVEFENIDVVVMNPPFGIVKRNRGLDLLFLRSALSTAGTVFSLHKYSEGFIRMLDEIAKCLKLEISWFEVLNLEIPMMYSRHRRRIYRVKAVFVGIERRMGG
jgi:putative methylase